jgi:hypothetical protein
MLNKRVGLAAGNSIARNGKRNLACKLTSRKHTSQVIHVVPLTATSGIKIQRKELRRSTFLPCGQHDAASSMTAGDYYCLPRS